MVGRLGEDAAGRFLPGGPPFLSPLRRRAGGPADGGADADVPADQGLRIRLGPGLGGDPSLRCRPAARAGTGHGPRSTAHDVWRPGSGVLGRRPSSSDRVGSEAARLRLSPAAHGPEPRGVHGRFDAEADRAAQDGEDGADTGGGVRLQQRGTVQKLWGPGTSALARAGFRKPADSAGLRTEWTYGGIRPYVPVSARVLARAPAPVARAGSGRTACRLGSRLLGGTFS